MHRWLKVWICVALPMVSLIAVRPGMAQDVAVGQRLVTQAEVAAGSLAAGEPVLQLTLERLPEAPIGPLSLEVRLPESPGQPGEALTTISFFGVPVGQITTFPVPLPKEALARLKDGRLPIELGLRGNVRPEVPA